MADVNLGSVIIIGGTGMLAGAARYISKHATSFVLGARNPASLASETGAKPLVLDWQDRTRARAALAKLGEFDLAISWLHDDGVWLAEHVEATLRAGGRSIRVHGSDSGDPSVMARRNSNPRSDIVRQTVILGWQYEASGQQWLKDTEICQGVIDAVEYTSRKIIVIGTLDE